VAVLSDKRAKASGL